MRLARSSSEHPFVTLFALVVACSGGSGDDDSATSSASEGSATATTTISETAGTESAGETEATTGSGESEGSSTSTTASSEATSASDTSTASESESGATETAGTSEGTTSEGTTSEGTTEGNQAPMIDSEPPVELLLQELLGGDFEPGQLFLASSVTREIRVYEADTLKFIQSFTHPLFNETTYNPRGMAFNERGNLVVATFTTFVEFSDYGVVYDTYPKKNAEATENVIFDAAGNLYTTTATGGTDRLNQYAAADYAFVQTIAGPVGAGQYTGITFDDKSRLFLASQSDNKIHIAQADEDFQSFDWIKALPGSGPAVRLEGLVFNRNGELVVAQADLLRYDLESEKIVGSFDVPQDAWPVPVSVDNLGNIYTSDFENGNGSLSADIVRFNSEGQDPLAINDPALFGPFGLAISGVILASDPPVLYAYQVEASDPDGDTLTYSLIKGPPGMEIDAETGLIEWWVTSKELGSYEIIVEVADGQGGSDQQMFTLVIKAG